MIIWHYTIGLILTAMCIYGLCMICRRRWKQFIYYSTPIDTSEILPKHIDLFMEGKLSKALEEGYKALEFNAMSEDIAESLLKNWKKCVIVFEGKRAYIATEKYLLTLWMSYKNDNMKGDLFSTDKEKFDRIRLGSRYSYSSMKDQEIRIGIEIDGSLVTPIRDKYSEYKHNALLNYHENP